MDGTFDERILIDCSHSFVIFFFFFSGGSTVKFIYWV